jgi:hypothetical protein
MPTKTLPDAATAVTLRLDHCIEAVRKAREEMLT